MVRKRRLLDRIHDRAWHEVGRWRSRNPCLTVETPGAAAPASSISADTPWVAICSQFADGCIDSHDFRRTTAVRDIVETVGPVDGRYYATKIRDWDPSWLANPAIIRLDTWGNPIRWPAWLLGTARAFSPTTLRYLAQALWLKRQGFLQATPEIVEIGVGFGGFAAMNAIVSHAVTTLVDLPPVERAALRLLADHGLTAHARPSTVDTRPAGHLVISNYAFTELHRDLQQTYFDHYIKNSAHGMLLSNAGVFSSRIGGHRDQDLVAWFRDQGIPARLDTTDELLAPGDHLCGVSLIHW